MNNKMFSMHNARHIYIFLNMSVVFVWSFTTSGHLFFEKLFPYTTWFPVGSRDLVIFKLLSIQLGENHWFIFHFLVKDIVFLNVIKFCSFLFMDWEKCVLNMKWGLWIEIAVCPCSQGNMSFTIYLSIKVSLLSTLISKAVCIFLWLNKERW